MPLAMLLSSIVLPALGGLTISARWPLPSGLTRLTSRWLRFLGSDSRLISSIGWIGVRSSKYGAAAGGVGVDAVDAVDADQAPVLLALVGRADGAGDPVADAQAEPAHLAGRDVDVVRARQQAVAAHEAVALVDDVEDAEGVVQAGALGLGLEDLVDEVVACARVGSPSISRRAPTSSSSVDGHLAQVADVEVVALARGLELGDLVLIGDGQAAGLGSTARPSIAARALVGTVRHGVGHTRGRWSPAPEGTGGER